MAVAASPASVGPERRTVPVRRYPQLVFHAFSAQNSIVLQACVRIIASNLPLRDRQG